MKTDSIFFSKNFPMESSVGKFFLKFPYVPLHIRDSRHAALRIKNIKIFRFQREYTRRVSSFTFDNRVPDVAARMACFSAFDLHRFRRKAARWRRRGALRKDGRKRKSTGNVGSVIFVSIPISFSLAGLISSGKLAVAL